MIIWLDAQLAPALAPWIQSTFNIETHSLRDLGLRDATDPAIFQALVIESDAHTIDKGQVGRDVVFAHLNFPS